MSERNTPQKTLESWKQIAAYLDRSERTVRRWEMSEGLPVHRREHEKQDTVFAYKYELDAWNRLRTKCPCETLSDKAESAIAGQTREQHLPHRTRRNHSHGPLLYSRCPCGRRRAHAPCVSSLSNHLRLLSRCRIQRFRRTRLRLDQSERSSS